VLKKRGCGNAFSIETLKSHEEKGNTHLWCCLIGVFFFFLFVKLIILLLLCSRKIFHFWGERERERERELFLMFSDLLLSSNIIIINPVSEWGSGCGVTLLSYRHLYSPTCLGDARPPGPTPPLPGSYTPCQIIPLHLFSSLPVWLSRFQAAREGRKRVLNDSQTYKIHGFKIKIKEIYAIIFWNWWASKREFFKVSKTRVVRVESGFVC
jgi:hypothetical protein